MNIMLCVANLFIALAVALKYTCMASMGYKVIYNKITIILVIVVGVSFVLLYSFHENTIHEYHDPCAYLLL